MASLINVWELKAGDKLRMGDDLFTFRKMDGMYAQWIGEDGEMYTFNTDPLFWNENGYYEPIDEPHGDDEII